MQNCRGSGPSVCPCCIFVSFTFLFVGLFVGFIGLFRRFLYRSLCGIHESQVLVCVPFAISVSWSFCGMCGSLLEVSFVGLFCSWGVSFDISADTLLLIRMSRRSSVDISFVCVL